MQGLVNKMWNKVNIVFKVKTPIHIGYLPFRGSLVSPTRYYIPGRNLWGAVTKRITEFVLKNPDIEDYKEIGKQVMENFRFSYFYLYDDKNIYFPNYTDEGLKYGDVDGDKNKIPLSEFEYRFIGSRISTAIDPNSLTAKDESLHEIEFINNKFKDEKGEVKNLKIVGCLWFKDGTKIKNEEITKKDKGIMIGEFNVLEELIIGGESKYGFGRVVLDSVDKVKFPLELEEKNQKTIINMNMKNPLFAHLSYDKNKNINIKFRGDIELFTGRGYFDPCNNKMSSSEPGKVLSQSKYYFVPGTHIELSNSTISVIIKWDGTMELNSNEPDRAFTSGAKTAK